MKAYKFKTKVSDNGTIRVPDDSNFRDQEVEVIIISAKEDEGSKIKASEFVNKWAGFFSHTDTDQSKLDYLTEKYRLSRPVSVPNGERFLTVSVPGSKNSMSAQSYLPN